jgi:Tol biopolymer transport system component
MMNNATVLAQGTVSRPRVSANGKVVIWNQKVGDKLEIMKYQDGDIVNLSSSPGTHDLNGDLNSDGSVIAWKRAYDDGTEVVTHVQGREKIIDGVPAEIGRISVSDDGSTVAYDENTMGGLSWNIRRYREGKVEQITNTPKLEAFPFLSADGERLVYTRLDGKNSLMLKDGDAAPKEIVSRKESVIQPDISADGNRIVFSDKTGGDFDIHSRDLNSGEYTTHQSVKLVQEKQPQLASETGEIVYTGYDFRQGRPAQTNIYLDPGDGRPATPLTTTDGGRNTSPDFSENGDTVVWMWTDSADRENRRIYMMER